MKQIEEWGPWVKRQVCLNCGRCNYYPIQWECCPNCGGERLETCVVKILWRKSRVFAGWEQSPIARIILGQPGAEPY